MNVAILWHMHQPDYRDNDGYFRMPWTFLHAIKDYYDMPHIASLFDVKVTFNITPILMEQLQDYIRHGYRKDIYLSLLAKPVAELQQEQKERLLQLCKTARFATMVAPYPRFVELYHKGSLDDQEFLDVEVWFLLSWSGNYLKSSDPLIKELLQKTSFTHEEKIALLDRLVAFLPKILPLYASLQRQGRIALSTTPYTHPILPLLLDIHVAKEANPATTLPQDSVSLQEDAKLHIQKAITLYQEHFGSSPRGMWPAEGAVDEASLALYKEAGIRWIATDEAILRKSGETDPYQAYERDGVSIFFRDHTLSDLIGFTYRNYPADQAVQDFLSRLPKDGTAFVILDGENAWEFYPKNGLEFLEHLYVALEKRSTITFDEAAELPKKELSHLAPGSWIYGDFSTWIGDEEKNRAWELLFEAKRDALRHGGDTPQIREHFLRAEASDWFWWYGEGHYTEFAYEFDALFRSHLIAVYQELGIAPPANLLVPILGAHELHALINEPQNPITPVIDGKVTSFFEWLGSGYVDESSFDAMQSNSVVRKIFWGEDSEALYFRLDPASAGNYDIKLYFDQKQVPIAKIAQDAIIEIAVDKSMCPGRNFEVRFEIYEGDRLLQIAPTTTRLFVTIGKSYAQNWFI